MNLLALETSGLHGSIAALIDDRLCAELKLPDDCRSAQSLAPGLQQILKKVHWTPRQIDLVAVARGPGSFTGLRVGVTTAKTLAYATDAKIIGLNTLTVIARQTPADAIRGDLHVVMDAQRRQLFTAVYRLNNGVLKNIRPTTIVDREAWIAQLDDHGTVTGPGLSRCHQPSIAAQVIDAAHWLPHAETVGRLGMEMYLRDGADDLWTLSPDYCRPSAAEEKAKEPL